MRIDFFEEYPNAGNLAKASLVPAPSTIYLAAHTLQEFEGHRDALRAANPTLEAAYWPLIGGSYWLSPFSPTAELERLEHELKAYAGPKLSVLLDLELPFMSPRLFLQNPLRVLKNKRIIRRIIALPNLSCRSAEYPVGRFARMKLKIFGVAYDSVDLRIPMLYSSMINGYDGYLKPLTRLLEHGVMSEILRSHVTNVGLGTIAKGVLGTEPILSPEELRLDLATIKGHGAKAATIFRLGGMNEAYATVLREFI